MKQIKPSKICVACGLDKPLSAFLQVTGAQGTSYGSVCSTCRGSGLGRKVTLPTQMDEENPGSSGLKIDAKTKVQTEIDKRDLAEKIKNEHLKEKDKLDSLKDDHADHKKQTLEQEKKHRESYLNHKKKDSFLNYQSKKSEFVTTSSGLSKPSVTDEYNKETNKTLETQKKTTNFSSPVLDQHTAQTNRNNPMFKAWEDLIGESAAIKTVRRQFLNTKTSQQPATSKSAPPAYTAPTAPQATNETPNKTQQTEAPLPTQQQKAPEHTTENRTTLETPKSSFQEKTTLPPLNTVIRSSLNAPERNAAVDFIKETWEPKPTSPTTKRR